MDRLIFSSESQDRTNKLKSFKKNTLYCQAILVIMPIFTLDTLNTIHLKVKYNWQRFIFIKHLTLTPFLLFFALKKLENTTIQLLKRVLMYIKFKFSINNRIALLHVLVALNSVLINAWAAIKTLLINIFTKVIKPALQNVRLEPIPAMI